MLPRGLILLLSVFCLAAPTLRPGSTRAEELRVHSAETFRGALRRAQPGDQILLEPGVYQGRFYAERLTGVAIRSFDATQPAVIDATGAGEGLKLSSATRVTVSNLIIENAGANGINIDDGGFKQLSRKIVLRDLTVRNGAGHGIKFAGVDEFVLDRITLQDWGDGHAGFNLIGAHRGIVSRCGVRRTNTSGGFGIKIEGGSTKVAVRASRFEDAGERAIQFGGSVKLHPFRTRTTDGLASQELAAEGNVIVNRESKVDDVGAAVAWIGVRDAEFRSNLVYQPHVFIGRLLLENADSPASATSGCVFRDNLVLWHDRDIVTSVPFNLGAGTRTAALTFSGNRWHNRTRPESSRVVLPTPETNRQYGPDPEVDPDRPMAWRHPWGLWIVNATDTRQNYRLGDSRQLKLAVPLANSQFDPALTRPLVGKWKVMELTSSEIVLAPFSDAILVGSEVAEQSVNP